MHLAGVLLTVKECHYGLSSYGELMWFLLHTCDGNGHMLAVISPHEQSEHVASDHL